MFRIRIEKGIPFTMIITSVSKLVLVVIFGCSLQPVSIKAQDYGQCLTPNRERATCIELEKCQFLYNLLQDPSLSQTDRSFLARSQCGYINNKVLICCPAHQRVVQQSEHTTTQRSSASVGSRDKVLPAPPQCGIDLTNRIYGGNITAIDEFPWMALIEYTKPENKKGHHCGGALISSRYVLTAAHCVKGRGVPVDWRLSGVRLGEWDTTTNPDCEEDTRGVRECVPEHLDVNVEQVIPHPQYNPASASQLHDIALLRLANSVTTNNYVKPICLPATSNLRNEEFTRMAMDVAGWGKTESLSSSSVKLKATVNVWSLDDCRTTYRRHNINLERSHLCAGGVGGVDSCRGDSGGPLMVQLSVSNINVFYLAGVVSFGPTPCGLQGWPGVYTRVGAYIDWIEDTMRP